MRVVWYSVTFIISRYTVLYGFNYIVIFYANAIRLYVLDCTLS